MSSDELKKKGDVQDSPSKDEKERGTEKEMVFQIMVPVMKVHGSHAEKGRVEAEAFQLVLYMKHFRVTDIIVKVADYTLIVDACHREHADEHGLVSRSMIRKHKLPKNIRLESLCTSFTSHGFLVIHAEWLDKKTEPKEK